MKVFEYQAFDVAGKLVAGRTLASSETELDRALEEKGLLLSRARARDERRGVRRAALKTDDLVALTTQLATITSAGVPIVEGLEGIARRMDSPQARVLIEELVASLQAGMSLSEAMAAHPATFSDIYRSSIRAGEASGALDFVLQRLAKYLEWGRGMRATAVQAMIYPCILVCAIIGLVVLLVTFVLPRIVKLFPAGDTSLPGPTRFLLAVSGFLQHNFWWFVPLVAAGGFTFLRLSRRPAIKVKLHGLLLRVPRMGSVARQIATANFASTAATLQAAGCDVFTTLHIAGLSCGNAAMGATFERATSAVRAGSPISEALAREPVIDPLLVQMVAVGEKSGKLDECLERLVKYYDDEVPRAVKRFLAVAEPAILLGSGLMVGFVLLAALLPIFSLYDKIG